MTENKPKCPNCKKETVHKYRPFCSKRCADVDLGRWFKESYAIAGSEEVTDESDEIDL